MHYIPNVCNNGSSAGRAPTLTTHSKEGSPTLSPADS